MVKYLARAPSIYLQVDYPNNFGPCRLPVYLILFVRVEIKEPDLASLFFYDP